MTNDLHSYVLDPLERAASTFVQQFTIILLATGSAGMVDHQEWGKAAGAAAFAALISLGTSLITFKVPALAAGPDLLWRVAKTFVQSFLGVLIAAGVSNAWDADWKDAVATAIPVALAALLKGLAALAAPWSTGASLLPNQPITYGDPVDVDDDPAELDSLRAGTAANSGVYTTTSATDVTFEPGNPPVS